MSIQLPTIDLTGAGIGTTGQVQLPQPKVMVGELGHLRMYNESGCSLDIVFSNGHGDVIPAGAWPMFEIEPETQTFTWTVTNIIPNAPIAVVKMVYYFPYEGVPPTPALGNSPIGITGGVQTSSVQTLSNENSILGTKIVDIGTLTIADLFDIFNDHFVFKVQQAGVAHTVLQGNTAGNPLSIGQAGDISEVLGALTVDQASVLSGIVTAPAANVLGAVGVLTHLLGTLTVDQAASVVGALTATNTGNNVLLGTGVNIQGASLGFVSGGDTLGITTAGGGRVDPHLKAGATGGSASAGWLESEGVQVSSWDVNSALKCKNSKPIVFNFGSVASIGFGAFTPGSGISAINHNFGFVPTIALWQGGQISNVNPGTTTASIFNCAANSCSINNFAAVNGFLLYIKA